MLVEGVSALTANHLMAFASFQWHAEPTYWAYLFFFLIRINAGYWSSLGICFTYNVFDKVYTLLVKFLKG